jgi:hypothetical protein
LKYKITVVKLSASRRLTKDQADKLRALGCKIIKEDPRHPGVVLVLNHIPHDKMVAALGTDNFDDKVRREDDLKLPFRISLEC